VLRACLGRFYSAGAGEEAGAQVFRRSKEQVLDVV
jgi:hypothetical protein